MPKFEDGLIDLRKFLEIGYLQEVNRQWFHPRGMALTIVLDDDPAVKPYMVVQGDDDPEGSYFGWELMSPAEIAEARDKFVAVAMDAEDRRVGREAALGYWEQPPPGAGNA